MWFARSLQKYTRDEIINFLCFKQFTFCVLPTFLHIHIFSNLFILFHFLLCLLLFFFSFFPPFNCIHCKIYLFQWLLIFCCCSSSFCLQWNFYRLFWILLCGCDDAQHIQIGHKSFRWQPKHRDIESFSMFANKLFARQYWILKWSRI